MSPPRMASTTAPTIFCRSSARSMTASTAPAYWGSCMGFLSTEPAILPPKRSACRAAPCRRPGYNPGHEDFEPTTAAGLDRVLRHPAERARPGRVACAGPERRQRARLGDLPERRHPAVRQRRTGPGYLPGPDGPQPFAVGQGAHPRPCEADDDGRLRILPAT